MRSRLIHTKINQIILDGKIEFLPENVVEVGLGNTDIVRYIRDGNSFHILLIDILNHAQNR